MALLQAPVPIVGQVGNLPNAKFMSSSDNLATVTAAGYLNNFKQSICYPLKNGDFVFCYYGVTSNPVAGTFGIFTVSVSSAGVITLSEYTSANGVNATLPTTVGNIATYSDVNGDITQNPSVATNLGTIAAGASGTSGNFISYPSTAANGRLLIEASNNASQVDFIITNTSSTTGHGPTQTFVLPPIPSAGANFIVSDGLQSMATGSSLALGKSTAVESGGNVSIATQSGVVTTSALTNAQFAKYSITMNNPLLSSGVVLLLTPADGTNTTTGFIAEVTSIGSGTAVIGIVNLNSAALNGTVKFHYAIF